MQLLQRRETAHQQTELQISYVYNHTKIYLDTSKSIYYFLFIYLNERLVLVFGSPTE
jgi:hypothetical protein